MKPCEDWHRKIVRVLDNEAGDEDKRDVAEHLHGCASCREFREKFTRIRGAFRSVADPKAPMGIRQNLAKEIEANTGIQTSRSSSAEGMYGDSVMLRNLWKWYLSAAAVLIAGIAFLGGRLSAPRRLPLSEDITLQVSAESDGITVSSDLVAWLDAACLFRQLGMEDRMAEAVESAGRLLPSNAVAASGVMAQNVPPTGEDIVGNQNKRSILDEILRPHESVESVGGILAQSFGGYDYENETD
jgi:anti-sigma factor RsiW